MTLLFYLTLLTQVGESSTTVEEEPITSDSNTVVRTKEETVQQPDLELLMFLGAWDDNENNQWLDPEVFSDDTQFNQQLDEDKATKNEQDPDHN